jgi:xanthine dehydrogenase YagS FAD-binding subunit
MCVALAALDTTIHLEGSAGQRRIPLTDLHRLPDGRPDIETMLEPGELITAVELPASPWLARSTYRKVRDRASYAFALVSVAAALRVESGRIEDVRIALGGVAHKPWRAVRAEEALRGAAPTAAIFRAAARAELTDAAPLRHNGFKVELAERTIAAVLGGLAGDLA